MVDLPSEMTVIEISTPGGPEVLASGKRPVPEPKPNEILIKIAAAGVNGPDLVQRRGHYPPPEGASDLLGLEVSGTVVGTGADVTAFKVGDAVCGLTNGGGYAEYVAVDAAHCLSIPAGVDLVDAAGLPETFFTVWSNVFMDRPVGAGLQAGERLLVHGGAGGIGSTAIQLGKAFGADVVATDSPEDRCQFCRELGADVVVDYASGDFVAETRARGGADVILDIVGGDVIAANFKAARHDARIVQLAFNAGSKVEINLMPVMLKRLTYTGATLRSRPDAFKAEVARQLGERVWPLFASGNLKTVTTEIMPLAQAAEAHRKMEAAAHTGKILLTPSS
jgi:NADPH2:quinone reductase